jgi:hypothetical protein
MSEIEDIVGRIGRGRGREEQHGSREGGKRESVGANGQRRVGLCQKDNRGTTDASVVSRIEVHGQRREVKEDERDGELTNVSTYWCKGGDIRLKQGLEGRRGQVEEIEWCGQAGGNETKWR